MVASLWHNGSMLSGSRCGLPLWAEQSAASPSLLPPMRRAPLQATIRVLDADLMVAGLEKDAADLLMQRAWLACSTAWVVVLGTVEAASPLAALARPACGRAKCGRNREHCSAPSCC